MKPALDILAVARTPFGKFRGALSGLTLPTIAARTIDTVIDRSSLPPDRTDALYCGIGMLSAARLTPAREILLHTALPQETPSLTIDRACCSGLTAIGIAAKDLWSGEAQTVIAGGAESLSNTPYLLQRAVSAQIGPPAVEDPLSLRSPISDAPIARYTAAEAVRAGVSREQQDAWALASHHKYFEANARGEFADERFTLETPGRWVTEDEAPRADTTAERLARLRTVHGSETITAGNAPGLNDGAAFLSLARAGITSEAPLGQLIDYVQVAEGPTSGVYTPALAIETLLSRNDLKLADLAVIEINEAFAATPLVSALRLCDGDRLATERLLLRVNTNGGAVALGHPLGASGARIMMAAVHRLRNIGGGWGIAAICGGFGQGDAVLLRV